MKKKILIFPFITFLFILIIFFYLLVIERDPSELPSVLIDKKIPTFEAESLLNKKTFISKNEFDTETTLVNFFATWCGPCKMVGPIVEEIESEYSNKLKVGKLDVDSNQSSASQQNVMSIPTLLIFKEGQVVAQQVGALSKLQLKEFIEPHI